MTDSTKSRDPTELIVGRRSTNIQVPFQGNDDHRIRRNPWHTGPKQVLGKDRIDNQEWILFSMKGKSGKLFLTTTSFWLASWFSKEQLHRHRTNSSSIPLAKNRTKCRCSHINRSTCFMTEAPALALPPSSSTPIMYHKAGSFICHHPTTPEISNASCKRMSSRKRPKKVKEKYPAPTFLNLVVRQCRSKKKSFSKQENHKKFETKSRILVRSSSMVFLNIFGRAFSFQCPDDDRIDWISPLKSAQMFFTVPLKRCMFIYPQRATKDTQDSLWKLLQVENGARYSIAEPKHISIRNDRTRAGTRRRRWLILGKQAVWPTTTELSSPA